MKPANKYRPKESPTKEENQERKSKKRNYGECEDLESKFTNLVISDAIEVTDPVLDLSALLEKQSMSSSRGKSKKKAKKFKQSESEVEFWKKIDEQFNKIEDQYVIRATFERRKIRRLDESELVFLMDTQFSVSVKMPMHMPYIM